MSYILDALRKSERERQSAAGQRAGMLSPVEIQPEHSPWPMAGMFAIALAVLSAALWWLWPHNDQPNPAPSAAALPERIKAEPVTSPQSNAPPRSADTPLTPGNNSLIETPLPQTRIPAHQTTQPPAVTSSPSPAATTQVGNTDPTKDMPPLEIAGYVHDAQGGSLAMINNQLVREGEEIAPGLRLIKIQDGNAIFSYKGFVFTR